MRVAEAYARLRGVPEVNVVRLRLPREQSGSTGVVSPDEFRTHLYGPVTAALKARGLEHVLAWAYSVDMPTAVSTEPYVSLTGMTFLRGRTPRVDEIDKAQYCSLLYAGPDGTGDAPHVSQSLDTFREWMGEDMPLPAMLLGVTGTRGNPVDVVMKSLEAAQAADGTAPSGTVFFVESDDIRSNCREWQFRGAVAELQRAGVLGEVVNAMPAPGRPVAGMMVGAATVNPLAAGPYLGGSMAEHLTSWAAVFGSASQTKLTAWIGAGAAASCGAVSEPYSAWPKFPHARFFVHYAAGCTMLESFVQAVRSPLQLLLVGDPLAAPWGARPGEASVTVRGVGERVRTGKVRLESVIEGREARAYRRVAYYLDGRRAGEGRVLWLDLSSLAPGEHTLRAVASRTGLVRPQVFGEKRFMLERAGVSDR